MLFVKAKRIEAIHLKAYVIKYEVWLVNWLITINQVCFILPIHIELLNNIFLVSFNLMELVRMHISWNLHASH